MPRKILIVDDDKKTVDLICLYLEREGYQVLTAYDGQEALAIARQRQPDLIILDWMLPKIDGPAVCHILRSEGEMPIIMLTARATEEEKLLGLDLGADDYVTKPFSPKELVARLRVALRRVNLQEREEQQVRLRLDDLVVDFLAHEVRLKGEPVHLTPKEFKLLETLAREPGRAFSRVELVKRVFGMDYEGLERTIDVHLMNLRKKIELYPDQFLYIQTIYGVGYKLRREDNESA